MRHKWFSGGVSYQDVPFQKQTRFNGDADARLAVTLNIAAKEKEREREKKNPQYIGHYCV